MTNIDFEKYKNTPLYTEHQSIRQICNPLKKIGIHGFIFIRHYQDNTFLDFSNQLEWSTYFLSRYLEKKYQPADINNHMFIEDGVSLWTLNPDNIVWQEGQKYFEFGNGISISQNHPQYHDIYCFYARARDQHMNRFYINNLDVLKLFITYFKEKARDIINKSNKNRFLTPDIYHSNYDDKNPDQSNVCLVKRYMTNQQKLSYRSIKEEQGLLTLREMQCLQLCAHGLSAKQIADNLSISNRTVEARIKSARDKLGCKNICELIYKFTKHYVGGFSQR